MSTSYTDLPTMSDVLKYCVDEAYCFDAVFIKNTSGQICSAGEIFAGCLLRNNAGVWETLLNANVSSVAGIVIDARKIEAIGIGSTSLVRYKILVRGPARINHDALPLADLAGTTYTAATLTTALAALGIVYHEESPTIGTQTY